MLLIFVRGKTASGTTTSNTEDRLPSWSAPSFIMGGGSGVASLPDSLTFWGWLLTTMATIKVRQKVVDIVVIMWPCDSLIFSDLQDSLPLPRLPPSGPPHWSGWPVRQAHFPCPWLALLGLMAGIGGRLLYPCADKTGSGTERIKTLVLSHTRARRISSTRS